MADTSHIELQRERISILLASFANEWVL